MWLTPDLVAWQRKGYPSAHRNKLNLVLHLATAPVFVAGALGVAAGLLFLKASLALAGLGAILLAVAAQGFGHSREQERPQPFQSPLDFAARLFVENTFNFWRFLLSGDLRKNWRR